MALHFSNNVYVHTALIILLWVGLYLLMSAIIMWSWNAALPYVYPGEPSYVQDKRKLPYKIALLFGLLVIFALRPVVTLKKE